MYGFRNTFIRDAQGQPCYRTWSMGAFVDLSTGKLARIADDAIASLTLDSKQEMNYRGRRIILPKQEGNLMESVKVMRADIDYNRHMNNANYVRIAMELLPEGFEVRDMRVEYRIAAKLGDMLTPTLYPIDSGYIVALAIDGQPSAIIEFLSHPQ
jgi:acyl-ACP thioesterase